MTMTIVESTVASLAPFMARIDPKASLTVTMINRMHAREMETDGMVTARRDAFLDIARDSSRDSDTRASARAIAFVWSTELAYRMGNNVDPLGGFSLSEYRDEFCSMIGGE